MKKVTCLLCLTLTMVLNGCSATSSISINKSEETTKATKQNTKNKYIMAGKIDTNDQVNIASRISARVSEVLINVGSKVNQGDVVIKLDTTDLQAQVGQAQAAVNTANANLANAMNSIRPEQISQAQASLDSATENYKVVNKNYERMKVLVEEGINTQQQLEAAHQQVVAAEAQKKSSQEQLNILKNGVTETSINVYKAQVQQAEAALKTSQTALNNGVITSPISGVVNAKNINVGEIASPGTALASISNHDSLVVNAYAPLDIINGLKEGQDVVVKVAEVENTEFKGKILVINTKLNSQSRNVLVKVSLSDPKSQLKPGMLAEVGLKK
ncbi:multidrug resistance efflux pump [Clostridium pascui]|uniref:HlyD family secretion protein n=1 Tax=Clostridium pascui TaxID=46609 RepID=UPI001955FF68|nr:efflux RND transporter periplasmic adaptor subunit [Clostridium pascui]MBM7868775.1 multidrug resistance efflux pump [Clostridium pascui]